MLPFMSVSQARPINRAKPAAQTVAWETILLALLAIPLGIALAALAWRSTLTAPINYNEGCNAYFVAAVLSGGPLYFPPEALTTNNYPPLSFLLEAPLATLMGDAIFAGRLLAWLSFAAIAGLIGAIVHRLNRDRLAAMLAVMLFAGCMVINYDIYVGMNDPQMLAHAGMLLGLWLLLRHGLTACAAVVMAAALFAKHNIIALPLSVALWLLLTDRRAALRFIATGIASGVAGLALCLIAYGHNLISSLLAPRQYVPVRAWRHAVEWMMPIELPVLLAALAAVVDRKNRYTLLFTGYGLIALLLAWAFAGGAGVNFNLMFDVVIAFSLAAGQLLACLRPQRSLRLWAIGAYAFAAVVSAGLVATKGQLLLRPWIASERAREAASLTAIRAVASRPAPALCENLAICYWAGKPLELDAFNFGQGVIAGTKQERPVLQRIASGGYGAIELNVATTEPSFLGPRIPAAVMERYRKSSIPSGPFEIYTEPHD